jgi:hypothetical protein
MPPEPPITITITISQNEERGGDDEYEPMIEILEV